MQGTPSKGITLDLWRHPLTTSELGMCIFRKVESPYWIWFLQGARGPSETLLACPREKGNGLVLSKLSPIAPAWPRFLMMCLCSGTRSRFLAIGFRPKVRSAPAPGNWWGWWGNRIDKICWALLLCQALSYAFDLFVQLTHLILLRWGLEFIRTRYIWIRTEG